MNRDSGRFHRWTMPGARSALIITAALYLLLTLAFGGCADDGLQRPEGAIRGTEHLEPTPTLRPEVFAQTNPGVLVTPRTGESPPPTAVVLPPNTPPPSPTAIPSPTPSLTQRLTLGEDALAVEDFRTAAENYQASLSLLPTGDDRSADVLLGLGQARLNLGQYAAAAELFNELLAGSAGVSAPGLTASEGPVEPQYAYYFVGLAYQGAGDCQGAIGAYRSFLSSAPSVAAYVLPDIAACYLALADPASAAEAYLAAVEAEAVPTKRLQNGHTLAELYMEQANYPAAAEQYVAVSQLATDMKEKGRATYLAGYAETLAGRLDVGQAYYATAVRQYPTAHESYLALQALIEAEVLVDDLQRGIVDYYAKAFEPAVIALSRYVAENAVHDERAHLFLAWSYEGLGNTAGALQEMENLLETVVPGEENENPELKAIHQQALIEQGKMLARNGMARAAAATYDAYLASYPESEAGPYAAWWSAALFEELGELEEAIARYQRLADEFPAHEDAAEALYRAGLLSEWLGRSEEAAEYWLKTAEEYPGDEFGMAGIVWLLRGLAGEETGTTGLESKLLELVEANRSDTYYAIRSRDIVSDTEPFAGANGLALADSPQMLAETEGWLRQRLELEPSANVSQLSSSIEEDGRLLRGQILWRMGLREEAKHELENLRRSFGGDVLASYQLALRFREIGLYRSSILAAANVMQLLNIGTMDAPIALGRMAYPVYYADLIMAEANRYGYDPLLQFALIRQESLYESFATSTAIAQGLSQVIPATGEYIAQQLNWPDYRNEELYHPYVSVAFGAFYLDQQIQAFGGEVAVALSAYNGGPGNAARWRQQGSSDLDLFLEAIDFAETRLYIRRIYVGQAIYRRLYAIE